MTAKSFSKKATAVPNGFSEEEVDSSESEDEVSKVSHNLRNELTINNELSSDEATNNEENIQLNNQKRKKRFCSSSSEFCWYLFTTTSSYGI
ncbi:unnamed protein product [Rotaria magnacalcarata]|uniref:Uncharacterized protein n=1 Tax=Rotaria magnacalcarata TaxID=392030 RepID=A0A816X424_9BILA|nr:unnamed protein product [Rotaria magnacalcarata]CAF4360061.1 unnamed protein product [Rotaria magnacalcarata]